MTRGWAVVGEVSGGHQEFFTTHTYLGGIRYSRRHANVSPFVQMLVGAANTSKQERERTGIVAPGPPPGGTPQEVVLTFVEPGVTQTDIAIQIGGGMDVHLTDSIALRVGGDYRRLFIGDSADLEDTPSTQRLFNHLRHGHHIRFVSGIVFGFGGM